MRFNGDSFTCQCEKKKEKKEKKRLKGFKFRTVMGGFYDDIMAAKASFCLIFHRLTVVSVLIIFQFLNVLCVIVIFF